LRAASRQAARAASTLPAPKRPPHPLASTNTIAVSAVARSRILRILFILSAAGGIHT
jgi:hypothetical protein